MEPAVTKLGIIAGGGSLPCDVAQAALSAGKEVHLIGLAGEVDCDLQTVPHSIVKWGEVGKLFATLEQEKCRDVVIIGRVSRPDLSQIHLDFGAMKLLPFIMKLKTAGGDDSLLGHIAGLFEDKGYSIRSVLDVVPDLAAPNGLLTGKQPGSDDQQDMEKGLAVIKALGSYDVGQAVVVARGHVLAIEGAEGTDRLLERSGDLVQWGGKDRRGVLVKAAKPGQDRRIDLPTIGPRTVELAARANLSGIAVAAGETLIADRKQTLRSAEQAGLFIMGVDPSADAEKG
jgi:DUF1009 family protein